MDADAAQAWFLAGTLLLIAFGALHALLAVRDSVRPRAFAPAEHSVKPAMERSGIRLRGGDAGGQARPSMWSVWLGIHIAFGLALLAFGSLLALIAAHDFGLVERIDPVRPLAIAFSTACLVVALRFFFYGPVLITGAATLCFTVATVLSS